MMIRPTRRLFAALGAAALMLGVAAPALAQTVTRTPIPGFPHAAAWRMDDGDARPVVVILDAADVGTGAGKRFGPILVRMVSVAIGLPS